MPLYYVTHPFNKEKHSFLLSFHSSDMYTPKNSWKVENFPEEIYDFQLVDDSSTVFQESSTKWKSYISYGKFEFIIL